MNDLTPRDRELVALGAAMGSNCQSCVEYHVPKAREAGLTDQEIHSAIKLADFVRQVPAGKTLQTALGLLPHTNGDAPGANAGEGCGCEAVPAGAAVDSAGEGCGCS